MNQEENRNLEINEAELEQISGGNAALCGRRCRFCGGEMKPYDAFYMRCAACGKKDFIESDNVVTTDIKVIPQ